MITENLILVVASSVPGVIVLLTNQWLDSVVANSPSNAKVILDNSVSYLENTASQIQYMTSQFVPLRTTLASELSGRQESNVFDP